MPRIKISAYSSGKNHYSADTRCENYNGALSHSTYAHKSIIKIHPLRRYRVDNFISYPTPAYIWSLRKFESRIKIAPSICHRSSNRSYYRNKHVQRFCSPYVYFSSFPGCLLSSPHSVILML